MTLLRILPRFRAVNAAIDELRAKRTWCRSEIESYQLNQINWLWGRACETVSYYGNLKSERDLPDRFDSLATFQEQMPVLQKAQVRDNREQFLSLIPEQGKWHRTGGSSGIPTSVYWSTSSHLNNLRLRYAWIADYGIDLFDSQAMLWGHAGSFAPGLRGRIARFRRPIEDWLRNRQRFSAYNISDADLDRYLELINRRKTNWIYGYSSVINLLASRSIATNVSVECLKLLAMTGEPAMPSYSKQITQAFNAPGRIEYGSVECGNIAFESAERNLEIQEHSRFVETVERNDGTFDIVITVLDNPSFPLFRYMIGDTTSSQMVKPKTGYSRLADVQGRDNDFLVSKQGSLVHSNAIKHALENLPGVNRFQAIQDLDATILLVIETTSSQKTADSTQILSRLQGLLGGVEIRIEHVNQIQGNLAGKHTWVVSKLFEQRNC